MDVGVGTAEVVDCVDVAVVVGAPVVVCAAVALYSRYAVAVALPRGPAAVTALGLGDALADGLEDLHGATKILPTLSADLSSSSALLTSASG
ncbi:MAG: hypothetical protein ACP5I3_06735 [Thermoproteus sp.]